MSNPKLPGRHQRDKRDLRERIQKWAGLADKDHGIYIGSKFQSKSEFILN